MNYNEDFLRKCIDFFGEDKQQIVAIEEMAELTQALSKNIIGHRNATRKKVVEEFIDVTIMLNQIRMIYNITLTEIEEGKKYKFSRLENYIENIKNETA